ncbi:MAG: NYN domain-containing protein [Nocardioidaceae bacterium]
MNTDPLPADARAAMISIASDAIGRMPVTQVPTAIRKSAAFAPARRAKLVGRQIAEALASDDEFRAQLGVQVRAMVPRTVVALETKDELEPSELASAAAVAYLVRTDGWQDVVAAAEAAQRHHRGGSEAHAAATVERLTTQLLQARAEAKQQRTRLREQIEALKQDNAGLRRTLGQTRVELKDAQSRTARALDDLEDVRRAAEVAARETAADVRRLRAKVSDLESESSATRRVARDDRDAEVVRLRLLLETMAEAASGLRRELSLPASTALPADGVAALEPGVVSAASSVGRALLSDDPLLLRRLLELPRLHLVVDGYNVSKEAWPSAPLEQQRTRLVAGLAGLVGGKGVETTVVFDGADLLHTPAVPSPRAVRVRFSPPGVIADDIIRQLVAAEPSGRPVVVVSTDREVAESITKMGARSVASAALVAVLGR